MNIQFKYISICLNIVLLNFGTYSDHIRSVYKGQMTSRNLRIKRQAGYVYDRPTVSFDLPTTTSVTTTQAPTVDRTQMQMYYAYPVPAVGGGDAVNIGQQSTGTLTGSSNAVTSGASGYNYGVQNTQGGGSQSGTFTETQNTVATGYQNTAVTATQNIVNSGSTGYSDTRPISVSTSDVKIDSISTSAPRYLPPKTSGDNTVGISVTTANQAQAGPAIGPPSESYIPPSLQVSPQNTQTVTITRSQANTATSSSDVANPNTGYILPNPVPQQAPVVSYNTMITTSSVQTQQRPVQSVPTQQYLPPIESSGGSKTQLTVTAPASTYLPPVL